MVIPGALTFECFGEGYFNSLLGLRYQRIEYKIRKLNLQMLADFGIKKYSDFSRLFHQYIACVDPVEIYNYWEGVSFNEIMNDYMQHIILIITERKYYEKTT